MENPSPPFDNLNLFIGSGFLGADPDVNAGSNGNHYSRFSIGISYSVKKNGAWENCTEWVRAVCFGNKAERMEYANKGDFCEISGRMQTSSYEDPTTGEKKYSTEIVCNSVNVRKKFIENASLAPTSIVATTQEEEDLIPF